MSFESLNLLLIQTNRLFSEPSQTIEVRQCNLLIPIEKIVYSNIVINEEY